MTSLEVDENEYVVSDDASDRYDCSQEDTEYAYRPEVYQEDEDYVVSRDGLTSASIMVGQLMANGTLCTANGGGRILTVKSTSGDGTIIETVLEDKEPRCNPGQWTKIGITHCGTNVIGFIGPDPKAKKKARAAVKLRRIVYKQQTDEEYAISGIRWGIERIFMGHG